MILVITISRRLSEIVQLSDTSHYSRGNLRAVVDLHDYTHHASTDNINVGFVQWIHVRALYLARAPGVVHTHHDCKNAIHRLHLYWRLNSGSLVPQLSLL